MIGGGARHRRTRKFLLPVGPGTCWRLWHRAPSDLKLAAKRAAQHQYGVMSPAMKAAQEVELAARQQCITPDRDLIREDVECVRQQSAAVKGLEPKHGQQPSPKAIEIRTREEMEMGKKMNAYHASHKLISREPTPSKLRLKLK